MKIFFVICALTTFAVSTWADQLTKAVQEKLKEQGFFYGEATGQPGSETDAAIRRYQIRYGLKVTGGLNDETMKSLGLKLGDFPPPGNATRPGNENTPASTPKPQVSAPQALPPKTIASPTPRPRLEKPHPAPSAAVRPKVQPETPTYRAPEEEGPNEEETPENQPPSGNYGGRPEGGNGYRGGGGGRPHGETYGGNIFAGSFYVRAPGRVQSHVLAAVQEELGSQGFYRGPVDGSPGPETMEAISRFQETHGIAPSGHLNTRTLVALHAMPGQEYGPRVRRVYRGYRPYGPYGPYGPVPYGPYGPYGPYARNYW